MKTTLTGICTVLLSSILLSTGCIGQAPEPSASGSVSMHYLGHAAFILEFDNGLSVLVDYGMSVPSWRNPVHEMNGFQPDIVLHSHTNHIDHYLTRDWGDAKVVTGEDDFTTNDVRIQSIPTSETSLEQNDNNGFLLTYKQLKVLYLGEPLIYILNVGDEETRKRIKEMYPDTYDLVIVPLSGRNITPEQVEQFIDILKPERVVAVHYTEDIVIRYFLSLVEDKAKKEGKGYMVERVKGPRFSFSGDDESDGTTVIGLEPGPYSPGFQFRRILSSLIGR